MSSNTDAYNQLCCYTLTHSGADFIHQHVVDAFAAQDATPNDKPIRLAFALVGLYLHVERGFSGREVQRAHMKLCRTRQAWPTFSIPENRGKIDANTVLAAATNEREGMIRNWTTSVWQAFADQRDTIEKLLAENDIIGNA